MERVSAILDRVDGNDGMFRRAKSRKEIPLRLKRRGSWHAHPPVYPSTVVIDRIHDRRAAMVVPGRTSGSLGCN